MIFNKDFDRTLWLILSGDDVNREKLTYFLEILPKEMYDIIIKFIEQNSNLCHRGHSKGVIYRTMTFSDDSGYNYFFKYGIMFGNLEISFYRHNEGMNISESFELTLSATGENDIKNIRLYGNIPIGKFSYSIDRLYYKMDSSIQDRQQIDNEYFIYGDNASKLYVINRDNRRAFNRKRLDYTNNFSGEIDIDNLGLQVKSNIFARRRSKKSKNRRG